MMEKMSLLKRIKNILIGGPLKVHDKGIFHRISLIAFFAWIGLGADGLSSSCYGPQESFMALGGHVNLSIFVALGSVLTILVISASYSQIVELFPHGGGGYLVASKLLSPTMGMISGCALLIDYVLTITVSIASGADAVFSFLPPEWYQYRLEFALAVVLALTFLNMRGAKESILPLVPIFLTFLLTHIFIIVLAFAKHMPELAGVMAATTTDVRDTVSQVGFLGMAMLILRSYSMGAGTYTGLEAVSNGMGVLREPKVETAKRTMRYMAFSLSFIVLGLVLAYIFYGVGPERGKTLNAVLFERVTGSWGNFGVAFVLIALISEATLLFVGAQTGFLGGPRVLANMALDRWFPTKFSALSDRMVIQKGVLIMSGLALALMFISHGSVRFLVILYSINVFITFVLSQLGMVRHWWEARSSVKKWKRKLLINGVGLVMCSSILVTMIIFKFNEGGWITLLITFGLVILALLTKRHYYSIAKQLRRLNDLVVATELPAAAAPAAVPELDTKAKTAVLLVNGFNGMGLHTLFGVIRLFGDAFKNFVFLEIGIVDAGNFKGVEEIENLKDHVNKDLDRYVSFMKIQGYYSEGIPKIGVDIVNEIVEMTPQVLERFPNAVFFGGQLVFEKDSFMSPLFHNYTVFALQKKLYHQGIPFVILPIRV